MTNKHFVIADVFSDKRFGGNQHWTSFKDFTAGYRDEVGSLDAIYERLKGLTPEWALNA